MEEYACLLLSFFLIAFLGLLFVVVVEAYRRRNNHQHVEVPAIFEDPNSLKQVPCPHIVDPAAKYMSLIIPAFNEEHRLPGALDETMNYLQKRAQKDPSFSYEVVIIDDGSSDGTKRVAFEFVRKYTVDKVRVILLGRNHGKGEAIRKGMLHSRGELLLMLDADGATKVTDLEKLENQIQAIAQKEFQHGGSSPSDSSFRISDIPIAAFGSRAHLEEKALASRKWYRNFLMKGFHLVVLLAAGPGVRDTQCGFKMFTRAAARKLFSNVRLKRWCFDVELVFLCKWFRVPISEISVNWSEIPGSKKTANMMSSPFIREIKRQASVFLKEKIKSARLVLTDVTPVQLMTEEATNEYPWPPDTRIMQVISRAAFEVDEYWRIVEILHSSLSKFDKGYWRGSYKALILLEHLLTHGPLRVSEEFQCDIDVIEEIGQFQHTDERGFNWGLSVRKLSERILKLLRNKEFYKEERARARQLSRGIEGFGSFNQRSSATEERMNDLPSKIYGRCNSYYDHRQHEEYDFTSIEKKHNNMDGTERDQQVHENKESELVENNSTPGEEYNIREHPFIDQEKLVTSSLLSMKKRV